ncbi:Bacterial alpha-L-rhamnosidase [Limihaloglobus sulfuriphilus]|uniref:Bacterial alpha-L-rhamnosidase n=1 Tax=Limihaloglobus sulfuriphilus TaxID=1851148 RepID=A0A1Q2MC85_9BACT|nr:alpha-L-rhamnosidase C-terminal domain-containing protein [Limihaloglobus sulfuriphilus]AQQ70335.1 Bacterial alpha-L-rhamnosidase [Limihaloglobus sulfuriphilus]
MNTLNSKEKYHEVSVQALSQEILSCYGPKADFRWVRCADFDSAPFVCAYKREFFLEHEDEIRIFVTADERYQLYIDGDFVGEGSERGDLNNWFYETYDLKLKAGAHVIAARVWALGDKAPTAQISANPCCFMLYTEKKEHLDLLATGYSQWDSLKLEGFSFHEVPFAFAIRWREDIDGRKYNAGFRKGLGEGWQKADNFKITSLVEPALKLKPRNLPYMLRRNIKSCSRVLINRLKPKDYSNIENVKILPSQDSDTENQRWQSIQNGGSVTVDAHKTIRVIYSLDDYYCFYPELRLSGGTDARIFLRFSEAAYLTRDHEENRHFRHPKGNRDEIEGKYFKYAMTTEYISDGSCGQVFDPLWWFSGMYFELVIQTFEEPLVVEGLSLSETRYPLEMESSFRSSDKRYDEILQISFRTLQNCTHETYMDCPFYEQLMYVGDSRIESLCTFVSTLDDRMPLKAINIINDSRLENGLNMSCYPYRGMHVIPPFSLLWIAMVSDYACWRNNSGELVTSLLPDMRRIVSYFVRRKNTDGLISPGSGRRYDAFNFIDWVDGWNNDWGVPHGDNEINSVFHWLLVYTLGLYADMESCFGSQIFAQRALNEAEEISKTVSHLFWNKDRGLYADDLRHESFSEHAQILAILSGFAPTEQFDIIKQTLFADENLLRPTTYFSHYYFEVCRTLENADAFWDRMKLWYELEEKNFKTVCESTLPTRSDCHAWSSHPLYHFYSTVLGIRPAGFGFEKIEIKPMLGRLEKAQGRLVHPKGQIEVDLTQRGGRLSGRISVPDGLEGSVILSDKKLDFTRHDEVLEF